MSVDYIEGVAHRMEELEREAVSLLGAQITAAGDDTHFYRKSLVAFLRWGAPDVDEKLAVRIVDDYLREQAKLTFRDHVSMRWRRVIGGTVDRKSTPEQIGAAWRCFFAGMTR